MQTKGLIRKLQFPALLTLGFALTLGAQAGQQVTTRFSMPMQLNGTITETGCQNSPGPQVTLEGEIILGGLQVDLIFQNNVKGTHTTTVTYGTNVVLIPLGAAIVLPKQPVQGGVGGNPHIWIQLHNGAGQNLTDEIYLGRCVQGLKISPEFVSAVAGLVDFAALDCVNNPGPKITVGGTLTFSDGLHARFIFRNNLKGTHVAQDTRDVVLIVRGSQTTIPKQPVQGGAGGNPIISIQFKDGDGDSIGNPVVLGRCVQLQ
jgi:hypothetical protein